jgi:hypothetical protein
MSASGGNRALTIPKFASFKPKEPPPEDKAEAKGQEEREGQKKRDRRSDHGEYRHGKRRRHDSRRNDDQRRHSRSPRRRVERHSEPEPMPSQKGHSDVFFVDIKGDPLISRYGGVDSAQIPAYYRHGGGRILGSVGRLVMHRDGPRDQFSIRMPGEGFYSFKDKDGLRSKSWRLKHQPKIVRTLREDVTSTNEEDAGYISLQPARKRRRLDEDTDSSKEDDTPAYRIIEGKAGRIPSQGSDTSDDEGDEITPDIDQRNPLQWRSIQLNRQVKDHPEDIKAWLELVNHQDALLRSGEDIGHQALEHEVHSFAEIKVSMLESALPHATKPTDRGLILNRLMQEGCKVWNSKTAFKKWEQVRKDEDDNFTLWKTHLNYCMTDIVSFRYDAVKEMLLAKLRQVLSRSASAHLQNVFQEAIYIFLRTTRFMHDAGFKELAVGAWQAMLELTFFRPSGHKAKDSAMAEFRDFWESEVPRIGEPGALGWKRYFEAGGEEPELQSAVDVNAEAESSEDAYKSWANVERLLADTARIPARTMDEDNQDDPFRVIMYSDIEPLLFYIPGHELPLVQDQLLNGFLLFAGFPPFSQSNEWTQEACEDQFIMAPRGSVISQKSPTLNMDNVDEPQRDNVAFAPISMHVTITPDVYFPGTKWFRYLNPEAPYRALDAHWVHNTTQQLALGAGVEELSIYYLAVSLLNGEAGVKKLAKSVLKRYPSSLGLYNAYALAEFAGGHTDMAKRVLSSAVKLTTVRRTFPTCSVWFHLDEC